MAIIPIFLVKTRETSWNRQLLSSLSKTQNSEQILFIENRNWNNLLLDKEMNSSWFCWLFFTTYSSGSTTWGPATCKAQEQTSCRPARSGWAHRSGRVVTGGTVRCSFHTAHKRFSSHLYNLFRLFPSGPSPSKRSNFHLMSLTLLRSLGYQHCPCRHLGNLHGAAPALGSPPRLTCNKELGTLLWPSAISVQSFHADDNKSPFSVGGWRWPNALVAHCVAWQWVFDL